MTESRRPLFAIPTLPITLSSSSVAEGSALSSETARSSRSCHELSQRASVKTGQVRYDSQAVISRILP